MKSRLSIVIGIICVFLLSVSCNKKPPQAQAASKESTVASKQLVVPSDAQSTNKTMAIDEKYLVIPKPVPQADEFRVYVKPTRAPKEITLVCKKVSQTPVIDGVGDEPVWATIEAITTLDFSSQRSIELRTFHDGQNIYFLARYPDAAASVTHKSWFWDTEEKVYKPGPDREDMFILKWRMTGESLYLAPDKVEPHTSDIWFWKAARTNPSGYLDDKMDNVLTEKGKDAAELKSDKYGTLYLYRPGDAGKPAYTEGMVFEYEGDCVAGFVSEKPEGSRADIRGKGVWKDGWWTIEFTRKLDTGNADDIAFKPGGRYLFAATVYEMAGSDVNPEWWQPLYRTGDAFDKLYLNVE